jgi:hypothetical protein
LREKHVGAFLFLADPAEIVRAQNIALAAGQTRRVEFELMIGPSPANKDLLQTTFTVE